MVASLEEEKTSCSAGVWKLAADLKLFTASSDIFVVDTHDLLQMEIVVIDLGCSFSLFAALSYFFLFHPPLWRIPILHWINGRLHGHV